MADPEKEKLLNQIVDFRVFMAETLEWRKEQCKKLDKLIQYNEKIWDKFDRLPCRERAWMPINIYALWTVVGTIGIAVFLEWIKK
jgi:hypothetical protein